MRPFNTAVFAISLLLIAGYAKAQEPIDASVYNRYHRIIRLMEKDSVNELASLIKYPLMRQNPLPDIESSKEFIKYYPVLIDSAFKQKLRFFSDSDVFEHDGAYGLVGGRFDGDIWINEAGQITAINYSSSKEQELKHSIKEKNQKEMYPGVANFISNVKVLKSAQFLLRIDETDKGLRYVSWGKDKKISDKPDLVLYNGKAEAQGTQGGWLWTFKNGDWEYIVEDNEMCEDVKDCGYFLVIKLNGIEKLRSRCSELK